MEFTKEQKNEYLDKLALRTQEGIWITEMALMKEMKKLKEKKELLIQLEQKLENKEFESARDGKNQIKFTEDQISKIENEIEESRNLLITGAADLEMIEEYRNQ